MAYHQVSVSQLQAMMAEDAERPESCLTIFDTRDAASYAAGHIDRAQALNEATAEQLLAATPTEHHVVVCCYHGISSQQVADWLDDLGFDNVYSLTGGYSAWSRRCCES